MARKKLEVSGKQRAKSETKKKRGGSEARQKPVEKKASLIVEGFLWIFGCLLAGAILAELMHLPVPGSVIGMVLLTLLLLLKVADPERIADSANLLLENMSLLFVPAGVGLVLYGGVIGSNLIAILLSCMVSTFAVMAITAFVYRRLR